MTERHEKKRCPRLVCAPGTSVHVRGKVRRSGIRARGECAGKALPLSPRLRMAGDFYRLPMEGEKGDMNYESISSCARVRDLNRSISATYRLRERLLKALGKNAAPREGPRAASEQGMNSCGCDHYITGGEST